VIGAYVAFVALLMRACRVAIGILLAASVVLNLANVVGRYALHHPIVGAEELMVFLMVGFVFIGVAVVSYEGRHIKMDIMLDLLPPTTQRVVRAMVEICAIGVAATLIWLAVPVVERLFMFDERSTAANFPLWIAQGMIPLGLGLSILATIARLLDPARAQQQ
jgi:TRAP-type C4-dicarboxylate transport system permease small subunit